MSNLIYQNSYRESRGARSGLLLLQISLALFFALFLINRSFAQIPAEQAINEVTINEIQAGQLLFKTGSQGVYTPSLMLSTDVDFSISGMVAHVTVQQTFKNDSSAFVEGVYVFPLPEKAAVNHMRMVIGERVVIGKIKEKQQAKIIYQQAKAAGKKAALVEQQRPNMFTNKVANIAPGETVMIKLVYVQSVDYQNETFSLRFPMTITPRYIPGQPIEDSETEFVVGELSWGENTGQVPDASLITPFQNPVEASQNAVEASAQNVINPITIKADIDMGMELSAVSSAYHAIDLQHKQGVYQVSLKSDEGNSNHVSMNKDFVLNWKPLPGKHPKVAIFSENIEGEDYAMLMVLPPSQKHSVKVLPKEMIYIIDTSGSMGGVSIEQARQSLLLALDKLKPGDRFNIIEFNSSTKPLFASAVDVTPYTINQAKRHVMSLAANGGTEMHGALSYALKDQPGEDVLRQIVFITDGAVGNEKALFSLIHNKLGANRLFTVGIGSAPNSYFMRDAAKFGRGTYMHIGDVREVSGKMSELFSKLENPVATNLAITWPTNTSHEMYPNRIPDLYQGEPLLLSARLDDIRGKIRVEGDIADKHWQRELIINKVNNNKGVATVWAREKIYSLMNEIIKGEPEANIKPKVIDVALKHSLLSKYTSFVAVEEQLSRPEGETLKTKAIPNARPKGQSVQQFAYPKTDAGVAEKVMFGVMMLFFALVLLLANRYEQALLDKQSAEYSKQGGEI